MFKYFISDRVKLLYVLKCILFFNNSILVNIGLYC